MTRKSERELVRDVDALEDTDHDVVGLITVLSAQRSGADVSLVCGRRDLVRIDGMVKRLTPNAQEKLVRETS